MPLILGIETSCDETAAAVVADGRWVLSNVIASQHELHRTYGGVVPEIASRAHLERILPVLREAVAAAGVEFKDLAAVAVGNRPGLIGSLLVGVSAAKALAWALRQPLIGIDHVQAHLYAAVLEEHGDAWRMARGVNQGGVASESFPNPQSQRGVDNFFPALGLVVSGGHTSLYDVLSPTEVRLLGRTIDDAVGEAYDKAAVILNVGYPGGPKLDRLAQSGDSTRYPLPRTLLHKDSLDFSFSGLKTALLYKVRGFPKGRGAAAVFEHSVEELTEQERADLAASFQAAAVDILMTKIERALAALTATGRPPQALLIGGGVSANSLLRQRVGEFGQNRGLRVGLPKMAYCMDNAAMIAGLAHEYYRNRHFDDLYLPAIATTGR